MNDDVTFLVKEVFKMRGSRVIAVGELSAGILRPGDTLVDTTSGRSVRSWGCDFVCQIGVPPEQRMTAEERLKNLPVWLDREALEFIRPGSLLRSAAPTNVPPRETEIPDPNASG
jgi:hypothetical protein